MPKPSQRPVTTSTSAQAPVAAAACSASAGRLAVSHAPFAIGNRTVLPFGYTNVGPPCRQDGTLVVHLYGKDHKVLAVEQVNGDVVMGTAASEPIVLQHNDESSGFNIESATAGPSCVTAQSISVAFGGGATPAIPVDFAACGKLYVTTIYR